MLKYSSYSETKECSIGKTYREKGEGKSGKERLKESNALVCFAWRDGALLSIYRSLRCKKFPASSRSRLWWGFYVFFFQDQFTLMWYRSGPWQECFFFHSILLPHNCVLDRDERFRVFYWKVISYPRISSRDRGENYVPSVLRTIQLPLTSFLSYDKERFPWSAW